MMLHVLRTANEFDDEDHRFMALLEEGEIRHREAIRATKKSTNRSARISYLSHIDHPYAGARLEQDGVPLHRVAVIAWTFRRRLSEVITACIRPQEDSIALKRYRIAKYGTDGIPPLEYILSRAPYATMGAADLYDHIKDWTELGGATSRRRRGGEKQLEEWITKRVSWTRTGDIQYPWCAMVSDRSWRIKINDFPDEPLFTLVIEEKAIGDLEDWPKAWKRASAAPL